MRAKLLTCFVVSTLLLWGANPAMGNIEAQIIPSKSLSSSTGLSSNSISKIISDQQGFIWIATNDGLNRYDGTNILTLRANSEDSTSIKSNQIKSIAALPQNRLVLLFEDGSLQLLNLAKGSSKTYKPNIENSQHLLSLGDKLFITTTTEVYSFQLNTASGTLLLDSKSTNGINQIKLLSNGLPVACTNNGLYVLRGAQQFQVIRSTVGSSFLDISQAGTSLLALSHSGLQKFSGEFEKLDTYTEINKLNTKRIFVYSNTVLCAGEGDIWAFNLNTKKLANCSTESNKSWYSGNLSCAYQDQSNGLWLGSSENGLKLLWPESVFGRFTKVNTKAIDASIDASTTDSQGNLIIAGGNHFEFSDAKTQIQSINISAYGRNIQSILAQNGNYYLGIEKGQILEYNRQTSRLSVYANLSTSGSVISMIFADKTLYCGTEKGLYRVVRESATPIHIETKSLDKQKIRGLSVVDGQLIISLAAGILSYNPISGEENFLQLKEYENLSSNKVIYHDNKYWACTETHGLLVFDDLVNPKLIYKVDKTNGLDDNRIISVEFDANNNVWICTRNSIYQYKPAEKSLIALRYNDGLTTGEILTTSNLGNGKICVAGRKGAITFKPSQRIIKYIPVSINLTGIETATTKNDGYSASFSNKLDLRYSYNYLTLRFTAMDFHSPEYVEYFYKIEGNEDDWINIGNTQYVTFPNLDPGSYNVIIKAIDSHGMPTTNEISLSLKVIPPYYKSTWFRIVVIALIVLLVVSIYLIRISQERRRNRRLEYEVDKRTFILKQQNIELAETKEAALESSKAKSEFMATMSHEIRTPMNGLMGTLDLIRNTEMNSEQKEYVNTIAECGDNMLTIINEILDYSKIESGRLEPENHTFNLVKFLEHSADTYATRAFNKGLDFTFFIDKNIPHNIISDQTRIGQVLNNLVNNAIKFTNSGQISLVVLQREISNNEAQLEFRIGDTGIGIENDKLESIFDAFTQADSSTTREFGGTGLGLAICKTIVNALGGKIWVESEFGKGSTFYVSIKTEIESGALPHVSIPSLGYNTLPKIMVLTKSALRFDLIKKLSGELRIDCEKADFHHLNKITTDFDLAFLDLSKDGLSLERQADLAILKTKAKRVILIATRGSKVQTEYEILHSPIKRSNFYALFSGNKESTYAANIQPKASGVSKHLSGLKILLAEDNRVNQMVTSRIFKSLHLPLDIAVNGQEAIDMQAAEQYDIILMDLLMPEVDGKTATLEIRKQYPDKNLPYIIAFSANIFNQDKESFEGLGFSDVLSKPAKIEDIKRVLDKIGKSKEQA